MKKVLIIAGFAGLGICANAQSLPASNGKADDLKSPPSRPTDPLVLKENTHNFGKIPQGRPATYNFQIINTGAEPLRLINVQASCGCTTPEWSKEPIAPGASAEIRVGFNAYAEGAFTKVVTITYGNNQIKTLTISGEVYKSPTSSAPLNASVQFLKQINQ